ncbi:hypothetical protein CANARDRAFT_28685 [[Candida] arabinofermentans NRRL YB-2248]|uniref:Inositol-pentakisphosphate 2-kinase n=1 Tax=[Candida] arabinofermentans NRRL YB-2248 TaxID=983967 RepID=A0A1E4SZP9_9ASCO|nr:hypothetical protein CANARDRAFT_28685 [[Candida] arabinofermentans NRRL YB-2248]
MICDESVIGRYQSGLQFSPLEDPQSWLFLNKGSANAVFRHVTDDSSFSGKVIRLRLANSKIRTKEIYDYIVDNFSALEDYLPRMDMVTLHQGFVNDLQHSSGVMLNLDDPNGILMDNLFQHPVSTIKLNKHIIFHFNERNDESLFELKPKWLYDPPAEIKYCRNCSLLKYKNEKIITCNLKLLSRDTLDEWCNDIIENLPNQLPGCLTGSEVGMQLKSAMKENFDVIQKIYHLQNRKGFNAHERLLNLKSEDDVDDFLRYSMTLKDMTIVVGLYSKKLTILDLDKKSCSKWKSWQNQEASLSQYYTLPDCQRGLKSCCTRAN